MAWVSPCHVQPIGDPNAERAARIVVGRLSPGTFQCPSALATWILKEAPNHPLGAPCSAAQRRYDSVAYLRIMRWLLKKDAFLLIAPFMTLIQPFAAWSFAWNSGRTTFSSLS